MSSPTTTNNFIPTAPPDKQDIQRLLKHKYQALLSLDESTRGNIWLLFHTFLASHFALDYASKLNMLVENKEVANNEVNRKEFSRWFNQDVMEMVSCLSESELYDEPKAILALSEIIAELKSSLDCIEEDGVTAEMDFILDLPYRAMDIISSCSDIPKLEVQEFVNESQCIRVSRSQRKFRITGLVPSVDNAPKSKIEWTLK